MTTLPNHIEVPTPVRLVLGATIVVLSTYLALVGLQDLLRVFAGQVVAADRAAGPVIMTLLAGCCLLFGFRILRANPTTAGSQALLSPRGWRTAAWAALILCILLGAHAVSRGATWWEVAQNLGGPVMFAGWCLKASRGVAAPHEVEYYKGRSSNSAMQTDGAARRR